MTTREVLQPFVVEYINDHTITVRHKDNKHIATDPSDQHVVK